jgi:hypothetical protein
MLIAHAERYISLRQTLGFKLKYLSGNLSAFARFAVDRGDTHIRVATAVDWATAAPSPHARHIRLRDVARLARFLHAEDPIHEVPTNPLCASAPSPAIHLLTGRDCAAPGRGWSASQIVPVPTSSLRDVAWADCCDWAPRLVGTRPPVLRCTARWRPANSSH